MLQEIVDSDTRTVSRKGKASSITDRKQTSSELKKELSEEKVPADIEVTCYEMYIEMYNVAKYLFTETTAYVIQQRFCNEVQTIIQFHFQHDNRQIETIESNPTFFKIEKIG